MRGSQCIGLVNEGVFDPVIGVKFRLKLCQQPRLY